MAVPILHDEPKTDPRIRVHFVEIKELLRVNNEGLLKSLEHHETRDESRFNEHEKSFVSYKWIIGVLAAALSIGTGLATWTVKTSAKAADDAKGDMLKVIHAHEEAVKVEVQALHNESTATLNQVNNTNSQVQSIYNAIVDEKIRSPHAAAKAAKQGP